MKYRKKPVVIEAAPLTAEGWTEVLKLAGWRQTDEGFKAPPNGGPFGEFHYEGGMLRAVEVITLEGTMLASYGDYIIKGTHGEFYPCKAHIFEENYEQVEEQQ